MTHRYRVALRIPNLNSPFPSFLMETKLDLYMQIFTLEGIDQTLQMFHQIKLANLSQDICRPQKENVISRHKSFVTTKTIHPLVSKLRRG